MAASITPGYVWTSTGTVTNTNLATLITGATISGIDQSNLASGYGLIITALTAPSNTNALWLDSSSSNTPKYYNGSSWTAAVLSPPALGQCRLAKSGANLVLSPYNGNLITINGALYSIPAAGASLAPTSLSVGATYNIYAYVVGSTVTLEASATAHATSSTAGNIGVEIKSGDDTRTLVGMARTTTGPAWVDTAAQRYVLNWFNRRTLNGAGTFSSDRSTSSTSYVELNTEIRTEFLTWGTENVFASVTGSGVLGGSGHFSTAVGFNGTTLEPNLESATGSGASDARPIGISGYKNGLTEGYNYATVLGRTNGATGTWASSSTTSTAKVYINIGVEG